MSEIKLTRGFVALVDDDDHVELSKYKWWASAVGYAYRTETKNGVKVHISMHRQIMNAKPGEDVDHINHQRFDNRKLNLRLCSRSQNSVNRRENIPNKTGFKGVAPSRAVGRYWAHIKIKKKIKHLGTYDSAEEAYEVYCLAEDMVFGEFVNKSARIGETPIAREK